MVLVFRQLEDTFFVCSIRNMLGAVKRKSGDTPAGSRKRIKSERRSEDYSDDDDIDQSQNPDFDPDLQYEVQLGMPPTSTSC